MDPDCSIVAFTHQNPPYSPKLIWHYSPLKKCVQNISTTACVLLNILPVSKVGLVWPHSIIYLDVFLPSCSYGYCRVFSACTRCYNLPQQIDRRRRRISSVAPYCFSSQPPPPSTPSVILENAGKYFVMFPLLSAWRTAV